MPNFVNNWSIMPSKSLVLSPKCVYDEIVGIVILCLLYVGVYVQYVGFYGVLVMSLDNSLSICQICVS